MDTPQYDELTRLTLRVIELETLVRDIKQLQNVQKTAPTPFNEERMNKLENNIDLLKEKIKKLESDVVSRSNWKKVEPKSLFEKLMKMFRK